MKGGWRISVIGLGLAVMVAAASFAITRRSETSWDLDALTVPVTTASLQVRITASGRIQPVRTVNLSPKAAGILAELLVEQGEQVSAGQVVARMDAADLEAQVQQAEARVTQSEARLQRLRAGSRPEDIAQAEARVAQLEARLAEAETRLALTEARLERNQTLSREGALAVDALEASEQEQAAALATVALQQASLQEAIASLAVIQQGSRREEIAEAEAQLQEAIASLAVARVRLDDTVLRAPFAGIVSQRYANVGAFVTPTTSASDASSATSTAVVALADGLEVLAEVPEIDTSQLFIDQPVEIIADAFPDQVFAGRVRLIAPEAVVRQNVTSFQVRVQLDEGLDRLRSGMNVDVTFLGEAIDDALVVPTVAIVTQQGDTGVLVPGDRNRIRFRRVTLGFAVGNETQVLSGLNAGERIFVDLPPGQQLENLTFGRD